ncbi:hypothetical protein [Halopenitus sp. POP-27]|nr:hypothetical protein [Halopenitus sp. POP-27]
MIDDLREQAVVDRVAVADGLGQLLADESLIQMPAGTAVLDDAA